MSAQKSQEHRPPAIPGGTAPLDDPLNMEVWEGPGYPRGGGPVHGADDEVRTEVAIVTHIGLNQYAASSQPQAVPNQNPQNPQGGGTDAELIRNLVVLRETLENKRFRHNPDRLPPDLGIANKIGLYLDGQVRSTLPTNPKVVRILIFAGHGVKSRIENRVDQYGFSFETRGPVVYSFHDLRDKLVHLSSNEILAIPVLCCCHSGKFISLIDAADDKPQSSVVIAACLESDTTNQSYLGNDFLLTFLEAFDYEAGQTQQVWDNVWRDWDSYEARLRTLIQPRNLEQIPILKAYTQARPSRAFNDLKKNPTAAQVQRAALEAAAAAEAAAD